MIFLVTVRIGVRRRMKVAGPVIRPHYGGFCYTSMTFLKSQRRFSFSKEENYIGKAIKHFPTDEVQR